jgi:hypothetical protein
MKKTTNQEDYSTIKEGEYHPSADSALSWYKEFIISDIKQWFMIKESIASTALSGNRLAEICMGTINRLENKEPVSDRYLLGLCWFLKNNFPIKNEN